MPAIRSALSLLLLLAVTRPAGATWLPDGSPVATGGVGNRILRAVVPDGTAALLVAWEWQTDFQQVRVQRLLSDGEITPGWAAEGVAPTAPVSLGRSNPHVIPDGSGGCYVAWDEINAPYYFYVRAQHLLASGAIDPAWPAAGALVAQGTGPFFGTSTRVSVAGLVPSSGGGCTVVLSSEYSGCHDGFCNSGANVSFRHASSTGALSPSVDLEPYCVSFAEAITIPDGGGALYALTRTGCPNELRFRHAITGGEAPVPLPVNGILAMSHIARAADGSVLATVGKWSSSDPAVWFHWNADGSPAAGAPAAGVELPAGHSSFAPDATGSSVFAWQPSGVPGPLFGIRLEPDGSGSTGWPAAGLPLASAPAQVESFAACSDGAGGVFVVWQDRRNPDRDLYVTRRFVNGAPAGGVPASGLPLCTAPGNALNPRVVTLEPGTTIAVWEDFRSGGGEVYAQRIVLDVPVPATASLARAEARPDGVSLEWRLSEAVPEVVIARARDGSAWNEIARVVPGSLGRVTYEDGDVRPGESLGYRLEFLSDGRSMQTSPAWVEIPRAELALKLLPAISRDRLAVEVTLASGEPARLELVDVSGRQRRSLGIEGPRPGPHMVELPLEGIESSVAWLRLLQGRDARTLQLAITR